jgi:hypothetical protein
MEVDSHDPKNMSLADIIKRDKSKGGNRGGKGGQRGDRGGKRPQSARGGRNADQGNRQGGRPRFGSNEFKKNKGAKDVMKAKRTGNMISKQNDRPRFEDRRVQSKRADGERRVINKVSTVYY